MLSEQDLQTLAGRLLGTCESISGALEGLDLDDEDPTDAQDQLLDLGVELCPECDWWVESGELADDDSEEQSCDSCRG